MELLGHALLDLLANLLIIIALVTQVILILGMSFAAPSRFERVLRLSAITTAYLLYYGAKRLGIDLPMLMVQVLTPFSPLLFGIIAVVAPFLSGILIVKLLVHRLLAKENSDVAACSLIFAVTLGLQTFADIYYTAVGASDHATELMTANISLATGYGIAWWTAPRDKINLDFVDSIRKRSRMAGQTGQKDDLMTDSF